VKSPSLEHAILEVARETETWSLRVPTRIALGINDTIFDPSNADYFSQLFSNSRGVRRLANARLFWPEVRLDIIAAQARILWASGDALT
jgi:hypothetical protein